jgi:hypothetical protein
MKHTEPKIGQLVYVINKDIFVRVIDKESIEGITLFYTDDKLSYIEEQLHYVTDWKPKPEDVIGSLIYLEMSKWLTPDVKLRANIHFNKLAGVPRDKFKEQDLRVP